MSQTQTNLQATFEAYGVQPKFFAEFEALIGEGKRPGPELRKRLRAMRNYRECLNHLLDEMARPTIEKHFHFTFESLELSNASTC